jgi:anthranilate synthase component II
MLLMIDNYDSFTYNLVQYFQEIGQDVEVYHHDKISIEQIETLNPTHIVISPGPCTPDDAGISMAVIEHFKGKLPILGICLGHQCITQVFGGKVIKAGQVKHGKISKIYHHDIGVFSELKQGFNATRYHSLVADKSNLPDCLDVTAWTQTANGELEEIMGLRHKTYNIEGVQFHPESILSEFGHEMLARFVSGRKP